MATGIDAAASITALISFSVAVFNGCVKSYQLLSAAKHADKEVASVSCMVDWEEHRFIQWGIRIGLAEEAASRNPHLPWYLIRNTLNQLDQLFKDSDRLRSAYGLSREQATAHKAEAEANIVKSSTPKVWAHIRPDAKAVRDRCGRLNVGHRFRWVALDQKKIRSLLSDLGQLNGRLYELLAVHDRDYIRYALSTLLQDLVSRTGQSQNLDLLKVFSDTGSVDQCESIEAAVELKKIRLQLKLDHRIGESSISTASRPMVSRLKYKNLSNLSGGEKRQIAVYRSSKRQVTSTVLLEWKRVPKSLEPKLKVRIEGLTLLLSNAKDKNFNIPTCLGYVRRDNDDDGSPFSWYAHCYELALDHEGSSERPKCAVKTLSQAMAEEVGAPSLTRRLEYAGRVARAVLQLHMSGWLHKSILSDNLIFVTSTAADGDQLAGPFLTGFEYARADNLLEMTENPTQSYAAQIYRHPDLQKHPRPSFAKVHDLYSLGCVLAEIALWRDLGSVLKAKALNLGPAGLQTPTVQKYILKLVAFHAGDSYANAVKHCFQPINQQLDDEDDRTEEEGSEERDNLETSVLNQIQIVALLKTCKI